MGRISLVTWERNFSLHLILRGMHCTRDSLPPTNKVGCFMASVGPWVTWLFLLLVFGPDKLRHPTHWGTPGAGHLRVTSSLSADLSTGRVSVTARSKGVGIKQTQVHLLSSLSQFLHLHSGHNSKQDRPKRVAIKIT